MNLGPEVSIFFSMFVANLPNFLASLVAFVVILSRRRQLSTAGTWALAGFGLDVILCLVVPLAQAIVQSWVIHGGVSASRMGIVFGGFSLVWSLLRAASCIFLLAAVITGRPVVAPASSLPPDQA